jgi:predicted RNase H-like nuclease (RuvC/YqgF family)
MDTLTMLYHLAAIVGGCVSVAAAIAIGARGKAQAAISGEWRDLATAKAAKITDLETRVNHLEQELRAVRSENDEYRRLNLEYQAEVIELRRKVLNLERQAHERTGRG